MAARVPQHGNRALLLEFVTRLTELDERSKNTAGMEGILQTARDRFGLDRVALEQVLGEVRPKIEDFSKILGVDIGACPPFDELLATGCEELVRVSLESATATGHDPQDAAITGTVHQSLASGSRNREALDNEGALGPGSRILQYEVVEVIGRGATGVVLKAFDPRLSRHVAIKMLAPELANCEKAHQRFALEARFAAALRHEHIVAIHAVSALDGVPFLVMEYVHGSSLGDLLDDGRTFSVGEIARIGRQTALGLAAAHEARLVHRDIKPANILLENGTLHVRVADFGLARATDASFNISQPGILLGTPNYMSPEQVDGKMVTAASDLFSLGSVLYAMCTGNLPFQGETLSGLLYAVAEARPTPIGALNPDIPLGMVLVIEKLHAKNPLNRPPSAAAVAESLQPWISLR
jgi:serine/threonine protein kinase